MNNSPIGVFDSGVGGLSVLRELRARLPEESFIYFGDGKNCPYGEKSKEDVFGYIEDAVRQLLGRGVKMIVLACNTATVIAVKRLREKYDVPFVGMEPAVKPAAGTTDSGVIGVLATKGTLASEWFAELKDKYAGQAEIITAEGEDFVGLVEADLEDSAEAGEKVRKVLEPMLAAGVDRIVLGCTHYPFLAGRMREVIGGGRIEIVDPAPAIVNRVRWLLDEYGMRAGKGRRAEYGFMTAGGDDYLEKLRKKAFRD